MCLQFGDRDCNSKGQFPAGFPHSYLFPDSATEVEVMSDYFFIPVDRPSPKIPFYNYRTFLTVGLFLDDDNIATFELGELAKELQRCSGTARTHLRFLVRAGYLRPLAKGGYLMNPYFIVKNPDRHDEIKREWGPLV